MSLYPGMSARQGAYGGQRPAYRIEAMETAYQVIIALSNHSMTRDPEYVKAVIRSYVQMKSAHGRAKWEISQKLESLEREFPRFGQQFIEVRQQFGLGSSRVLINRRASSSSSSLYPAQSSALHRAQTHTPTRTYQRTSSYSSPTVIRVNTTTGATQRQTTTIPPAPPGPTRNPEDTDEPPPPPYASQDPDPEATRLLQERLAAEAADTSSSPAPAAAPPPATFSPPSVPPPVVSPPAHSGSGDSGINADALHPPADPEMARVFEESQMEEAKRASLAWQREQAELEEAMRLSLEASQTQGAGSSSGPGTGSSSATGGQTPNGFGLGRPSGLSAVMEDSDAFGRRASSYNPMSESGFSHQQVPSESQAVPSGVDGITNDLQGLSIPGQWDGGVGAAGAASAAGNRQSSLLDRDDMAGLTQQPLEPTRTGAVLKSKNPFLSPAEREEHAQHEQQQLQQQQQFETPGSSYTHYSTEPTYASPSGPPPPHLRVPTPPHTPTVAQTQTQTSPGSRPLPPTPTMASPSSAFPPSPHGHPQLSILTQGVSTTPFGVPPSAGPSTPAPALPPRPASFQPGGVEDPLEMLRDYDTVFLVDDSFSMKGERWDRARQAIMEVAEIAARYDDDGIDLYFLNNRRVGTDLRTTAQVAETFKGVEPRGVTPTGTRLEAILRDYMARLERSQATSPRLSGPAVEHEDPVKPMNLIVITDGSPTDDPESVIIAIARRLDKGDFPLSQVGIQFLQIGDDPEAREALQELDDGLSGEHGVRDMVDTVPYSGEEMSSALIIKTLLGGINRRLDRRGRL
ncbi:hypothetical protein IAT38_001339 [Cryptococcus sp. DSM 104549]